MKYALLSCALLLLVPVARFAQVAPLATAPRHATVHLQSGESVTGTYKRADSETVTLEVQGSLRTIKLDDVKSIEFQKLVAAGPRYGAIPWSFPAAGMQVIELEGKRLYKLGAEAYGEEGTLGDFKIRKIYMPAKIIQLAELLHSQDPDKMPDVDKFLTALAIEWAVTKTGADNEYLGNGVALGRRMYFYKLGNDANVAASVSADRRLILIMPAPSEK